MTTIAYYDHENIVKPICSDCVEHLEEDLDEETPIFDEGIPVGDEVECEECHKLVEGGGD